MDLRQCDIEDLIAELERREKEREEKERPKPVANPDWSHVQQLCEENIEHLAAHGYEPKDMDHYIYEAAIEAVFGKNVWVWINERLP